MKKKEKKVTVAPKKEKRERISQSDIPLYSLEESLRVAKVINDDYGGDATAPHRVAEALALSPTSSGWRMLAGSSVAYGLTDGGYNADTIKLTELGKRIVAPLDEGQDIALKVDAALKPRIAKVFFEKYNRSKFPREEIGRNVLVDNGVPPERANDVLKNLKANGEYVGIITESKTGPFVAIDSVQVKKNESSVIDVVTDTGAVDSFEEQAEKSPTASVEMVKKNESLSGIDLPTRVFITHGKNKEIVNQLKDLLTFGKFAPVVAEEHETTSKPVPEKVMTDMKSSAAGIIHIESEADLIDAEGKPHHKLNENVLIEIGAAMALYGERFVLLVRKGTHLPSNLQGLYRCEYEGEKLDYDATMKLLKIFNDFR
ncbi:MAG: TIR domain-containing protein [Minisyncoccia bacterium]